MKHVKRSASPKSTKKPLFKAKIINNDSHAGWGTQSLHHEWTQLSVIIQTTALYVRNMHVNYVRILTALTA